MIARLLCAAWLVLALPAVAQDAPAFAAGAPTDVLADAGMAERQAVMRRQLQTSQDRRRDLARSREDARRLLAAPAPLPPLPRGLLARDDVRRQMQDLQASAQGESRRLALLQEERVASARRLANRVAAHRSLAEAADVDASALETARLDMRLAEASVAELDLLASLLQLQRDTQLRRVRDLSALLARAPRAPDPTATARDGAVVRARLDTRRQALQARLAAAVGERERARAELDGSGAVPGTPGELNAERLANADVELDLVREAMASLAIEEAAWQLALRFEQGHDPSAVIDAREQGPRLQERLHNRAEFLVASSSQVLQRIGALDADLAAGDARERPRQQALRQVLELRLRRVQVAALEDRRVEALLARLRADFEARLGHAGWREKAAMAWASTGAWVRRAWNFELFTVDESVEVEGRKTLIARGVTVGKVIKAPLLLLLGMFLSFRLVAWAERRARRRGMDEARARLVRRWTLGVLACGWVLLSLALAGIPLAAFAFAGGAIAIGLGFGTQNLFKNLISGILVLVERPFRLGDVIEVGSLRGTVIDIDLRTSVVRDREGTETLIPNSTLVEQSVRNLTFRSSTARQSLSVQVALDSDPRHVMDAMRSAAERHGQLLEDRPPSVLLSDVSLHGLCFVLSYWLDLKAGVEPQRVASDLRLMVLNAFADGDIKLAKAHEEPSPAPRAPPRIEAE